MHSGVRKGEGGGERRGVRQSHSSASIIVIFTVIFVHSNYAKETITYWLMQMFILCVAYEWKYT